MALHLLHGISGVLMILVSSVICGRVPVGISRMDFPEEDLKPYQSSDAYLDLDGLDYNNNSESEDPQMYITDEEIQHLQNAQEKITQDQEIPACTSDGNCLVCCFSTCFNICKSPPIAVDWIPFGQEKLAVLSDRTKDTITIPGGCKVTLKQQKSLDLFLKYGHVTKCVCKKDDVVCYVRKRYPSVSPSDSDENLNQVYA